MPKGYQSFGSRTAFRNPDSILFLTQAKPITGKCGRRGGSLLEKTSQALTSVQEYSRPQQWFALRVKSRCERTVAAIAQGKDVETFLPLYQSQKRWSDRNKVTESPLFPGYIFCRLDPNQRLRLLTVPGAVHIVSIGKTPAPIDDAEIDVLQAAIRSGLPTEPYNFLQFGQRVRLEEGPLSGVEGIFMGDSKNDRIVVSISLLRRSVAIAIERHWVKPLQPAPAFKRN